jgi:type II secretory pathway component PulF
LDSVIYRVPWRRRRFQRDFVGMLALLLEADVPEDRAVLLAAEATANGAMLQRAAQAVDDLRQGRSLPEALRRMDRRGEFQWRLANAVHGAGQFGRSLAGWKGALEAKAFQQEQTAAQILTTGFVLANGLIVGLIMVGIFSFLVQMIEVGILW